MVNRIDIECDLRQIADMLLLNGTLTECPGLMHGKMGIAIFFFHYSQYTGNELFADYAMDLLSESFNQLSVNSSADYEKGIAGIGVGMHYLIHHDLLNVEEDVCEDLDSRMYRAVMYDPWQDFSLYQGLTGYGRYWITRLHYAAPALQAQECLQYIVHGIEKSTSETTEVEKEDIYSFLGYLAKMKGFESAVHLQKQLNSVSTFARLQNSPFCDIIRMHQQGKNEKDSLWQQIPSLDREKPPSSTGLFNGFAGEGMIRLATIHQTAFSIMNLL